MSEHWSQSLCSIHNDFPKCLLSSFCCYIGVGVVQGQSFSQHDRSSLTPCLCSSLFCCIGAGYNRSKLRKLLKISGSCLLDSLIYLTPLLCCAPIQEYYETLKRKEEHFHRAVKQPLPPMLEAPVRRPPSIATFRSLDLDEEDGAIVFPDDPKILCFDENGTEDGFQAIEKKSVSSRSQSFSEESHKEPDPGPDLKDTERGVEPLDGSNPLIYSQVMGTGPFSFLKGEPFNPACPPPTYLPLVELKRPKATSSKDIIVGLDVGKKGGLICTDQEAIAKQKGIIGEVFKQVISNISKGLGAVSISLPVRIFEPRSTCERLVDRFSFAPQFLGEAAKVRDPVARMKYAMAFAVSGLYLGTKQEKPFNPLLGETFQGYFEDGTEVFVEHSFHNPPTDHFDVIGKGFRLFGYYELDGRLSLNELTGEFRGFSYIQFPGHVISYTQPKFVLGGTMYGERSLNWVGEMEFQDAASGLAAAIRIGDDKHKWAIKKKNMMKDSFIGKIWRLDTVSNKKGEVLGTVYGSWLKKFKYAGAEGKEKVWQIDRDLPKRHMPVDRPLPSDWRYREDLIWLYRKNLEYAAGWKARVEARQRADRGLRGLKH